MNSEQVLYIPVILGTTRKGRFSAHVARFVVAELARHEGIRTDLIDIAELTMPTDDAGQSIQDPAYGRAMSEADAVVIVAPEYNHSFPGLLKHVLDSCLNEYIHKAAGIVGVSSGPFGGTRVIMNLLPVLRELGLVTIFWDMNFGNVRKIFDEDGKLLDDSYHRRADKFIKELIWMGTVLRYGRENIPTD